MRGLYSIKPWFVARLGRVEDRLVARRVSADVVTYMGLAAAVLAGVTIAAGGLLDAPLLWLAVPPLIVLRLACNALDGSIARRTRTARPFGVALNEICDRAADAAVIGPTAFVAGSGLGLGATAAAFAVSYTGVLSQGVADRRETGGPMGKADRMAAIAIASVAALFWRPVWVAVDMVIVLGCIVTAVARLERIRARLQPPVDARLVDFPHQESVVVDVLEPAVFEEETLSGLGR
jgi:phosphatidylglycerophosphate synthase